MNASEFKWLCERVECLEQAVKQMCERLEHVEWTVDQSNQMLQYLRHGLVVSRPDDDYEYLDRDDNKNN